MNWSPFVLAAATIAFAPTAFAAPTVAMPAERPTPNPRSDRLADALLVGRPDAEPVLATLVGGADCCPPPPPACGCEPAWKGKLWGSFSLTSGNTDTIAAVFGAEAIWTRDPWLVKLGAELLYGSDQGDTTAERYRAIVRGERTFDDGVTYVFGQVTFDRDEPAGLEYRFIPTLGLGRVLWRTPNEELKGEVGAGATIEKRLGLDETIDPSGYLGLHYRRTWEDKRAFHADLDVTPNLNDFDLTVARLAFLFEMPVSDTFRVTAGLRFDYVVQPPPGREDLDLLFTIGFSANF